MAAHHRMHFRIFLSLNRNIWQRLCSESNSKSQKFIQICFRHTGSHYPGTLRPLKVTPLTRKTDLRTSNNKMVRRSPRTDQIINEHDGEEDADSLADTVGKYSSKYSARVVESEHTRELVGAMRFIRFKTIEKKYFRKPRTPNLLTWAAKEQIKYLHRIDPKEWNTQVLSELFPVSEDDIKKIVKSKFRMFRVQDIIEHDLEVQENWSDLKISLEGECASEVDYTVLRNSDNDIVIENAAGIKDLPFPTEQQMDKFHPRGLFSAIVKDCYDVKEKEMMRKREELNKKTEQISEILFSVAKMFKMKSERKVARSRFTKSDVSARDLKTGHSEHLTTDRNTKLDYRNQQGNVDKKIDNFYLQKYRDSLVTEQTEESESMRHKIAYQINVQPEMQGKTNSDTYISGDCVYDSSGTFLYRIL